MLAQKASELATEVRGLGATLLATLEKRDAEALLLLRATQELAVLDMVDTVRQRQLDEATEQMNALLRVPARRPRTTRSLPAAVG